jgi:ATP-dependent protease ClpP protease subunit
MNRPSLFRHQRTLNVGRWYRVENHGPTNTATVYIFDEIGEYGISASAFVDELNAIKAPKIELRINTPGGNVFDGLAIFNAIKDHPAHVTAIVDGYAASAGSYILQAADKRVMNSFSQVMIHDAALAITMGNAKDHRETADFLDKQSATRSRSRTW